MPSIGRGVRSWTRLRGILEGKVVTIAGAMRRAATVAGLSAERRKHVDKCAGYLLKYVPYLKYNRYFVAGFPRSLRESSTEPAATWCATTWS